MLDKNMELKLFIIPEDIPAMKTLILMYGFGKPHMILKTLLLLLSEQLGARGAGVVLLLVEPQAVVPEDVFIFVNLAEEASFATLEDTFKLVQL